MNPTDPCPCGSGHEFGACCGPYLDGSIEPPTALALMRSRYTANTLGREDYLQATWHPETRPAQPGVAPAVRWSGLRVLETRAGNPEDTTGMVEFIALYRVGSRPYRLHEISQFSRAGGRWYYRSGTAGAANKPPRQGG
ncbi:MAG: hypothetical protein EA400_10690 [Chromatiaceae bacterium]|nr:MAG: hypothetical protein EA400_10690 [Chromatiaceae bacterium]